MKVDIRNLEKRKGFEKDYQLQSEVRKWCGKSKK